MNIKSEFQNLENKGLKSKNGLDIVFIFDKSGSMGEQANQIANAHNAFLLDPNHWGQNVNITTVAFDNEVITLCDGKNIKDTKPIKLEAAGATAIYDAVGTAIDFINNKKSDFSNPTRDNDVCYITVTDGYENASKFFSQDEIREKVAKERERTDHGSRDFILFGEYNIDNEKVAVDMGIKPEKSQLYVGNDLGVATLFTSIEMAITDMQQEGKISDDWKEKTSDIKVGNFKVTEIHAALESYRKLFEAFELSFSTLEKDAEMYGLSQIFRDKYILVSNNLKTIEKKLVVFSGVDMVTELVRDFTGKKRLQLENSKIIAAKSEIAKRLNANNELLNKIKQHYDSFMATDILDNLAKIEDCSQKFLYKSAHPAFAARIVLQYKTINNICSQNNYNPAINRTKNTEDVTKFEHIISDIQDI
jgi:uncharacterized protein YegL